MQWVEANSQKGGKGTCDGSNPNPTEGTTEGSNPNPTEGTTEGSNPNPTEGTTEGTTEGGCVSGWIGDLYCDDQNNNEECEWDGGDCCQGSAAMDGWDDYCNECQCLNEPCEDELPTRRCE